MTLSLACPKCNAALKLPGPEFLGKKAKCRKCQHRFILALPKPAEQEDEDEVPLTLAETAPQSPPQPSSEPLVGTSAKWVPDTPVPPAAAPNQPVPPNQRPQFHQQPVPGMPPQAPVTGFPPAANMPMAQNAPPNPPFSQPAAAAPPAPTADPLAASNFQFDEGTSSSETPAPLSGDDPDGAAADKPASVASRVRRRRRRSKGPIVVGIGTALMVISVVGLWMQQRNQAALEAAQQAAAEVPQQSEDWQETKQELAASEASAQNLSPTSGEPIPLEFMPIQPQLVCHLRPSQIWAPDASSQELIALTFDLGTWLSERIQTITRFEPQEIEEVTFGINFGARTSEPQIAAVVRLRNEYTLSELQRDRFRGELRADLQEDVYQASDYAYMMLGPKSFSVAPALLAEELITAKKFPATAPIEIEVLQKLSDRTRPATVILDIPNIDTHRPYVFGDSMQSVVDQFVLWFGKEAKTVAWSYHLGGGQFFMETLVHPVNDSTPLKVQRHMKLQMSRLSESLVTMAKFMTPGTAGYRKLIGRFPAMMKATELGTSTHVGTNYVRMVSLLPEKAGPNLAAGAMTTWNQALVTDFSGPMPVAAKGPQIPDTVAERLKMDVIVDFRRMPLQEAFAYIADEIKTPININGDALKLGGMTQNMPQTYNLGEVPAIKAIDAMVSNPDYKGALVIVVDEASKSIQLTTRTAAESAGLTIYDTKQ